EKNELPGFDHDMFALEAPTGNYSKETLIEEYTTLRQANNLMFKHLSSDQLMRSGKFGGNSLNVQGLWHMIAGHEKHHLEVLLEKYV
ncbi:MAG: DinB family protein, partial [Flavobacteriales bacterium]